MDIKNTARNSSENTFNKKVVEVNTKAPTVLTWMPGIIPVNAPQITPKMHANRRSKIQITFDI